MAASWASIKPEDVLKFTAPTKEYLCPLSANTYKIEFLQFKIRDMVSKKVIFHVQTEPDAYEWPDDPDELPDDVRFVHYDFSEDFLRLKTIGTSLVFRVGPKEVPNFRMIERHYFKNKLTKSFDFKFGFCIPNSTNSWEVIYDMPQLTPQQIQEMVNSPNESKSDSFYFVNDKLIMHNKAEYTYIPGKPLEQVN